MIGYEYGKLLNLKGWSARVQNISYLSQHREGNMSSSFSWHARYGHLNHHNIHLLRNNCGFGFPATTKKMSKCDACILGKHSKQPF